MLLKNDLRALFRANPNRNSFLLGMSLFLGNLTPNIRREELERVFRRFGRSNVNLKEGYGFVVYDLPANAEKALRALRGKNICGVPISLTWSNKQPKAFQRFTKGSRFYEPYHRRNAIRSEDYGMRKTSSHDRKELKMAAKHPDSKAGGAHMDDLFVKERSYHHDNIEDCEGETHQNPKENSMENDRWGECISDPLNKNETEDGVDFERYEAYHGYDRRDEDRNHQMTSSYGSPRESSRVKPRRERTINTTLKKPDHSKSRQICFKCGLIGHRMRNCPQADGYRREKVSQFNHRQGKEVSFRGRGEEGLKRLRPTSLERPHSSGDPLQRDRKSKENCGYDLRRDSRRKKRLGREQRSPKKYLGWKAKRSASRSRSHSPSSGTSSHSRSRSISSRTHSPSSSSRSMSTSSYLRSDSFKSMSKSRSPTSLSLSVSLDKPLPSSVNKLQMETSPNKSNHLSIKQREPVQSDSSSENFEPKITGVTPKDQNTLPSFEVEVEMDKDQFGQSEDYGNHSTSKILYEIKSPCMGPMEMEQTQATFEKPNPEVSVCSLIKNSTSISTHEMYTVLKHYGFEMPEENGGHLPIEAHFGSARLWPWEIIYYRRLKKGAISAENYARRVAQNREFGIVDKYIRSSSGWVEGDQSKL